MRFLIVILIAAAVAVAAIYAMDSIGSPSASGPWRTAIAGGLAGMTAAVVGVRGSKKS